MYQPRTEDIANELGIPVKDINYIVNMSCGPLPLELEHHDEDGAGIVELHEDYTYSPERTLFRQFSREGAMRFLNKLKDREKKVLTYRYQLDGGSRYTLKEIGKEMNLSPETIRQIELKALKKIRSHAEEFRQHVFLEAM
jgi:RNA polymerase primary sigma factor